MSQRHVESFIGRLATDRELRRAFRASPADTLEGYRSEGHELGAVEMSALRSLDVEELARFAETLDPRLRRLGPPATVSPQEARRSS